MANELAKTENEGAVTRYDGGLSSWSPDELKAMVAQEIELRSIVVNYYRSQMSADTHFYTLQGGQKPALSKEGALNLCSLFKVRVTADDPVETYHPDGHYTVRYRTHLISMRSGEIVADGDGSCSTRESKYAYRWVSEKNVPLNMDTATLAFRRGNWGGQYRIPNQDLADHYNTVLKMAYKRSIVAASLCLPLVSELFTQDIEEDHIRVAATQGDGSPRNMTPERPQGRPSGLVRAWDAESQEWVDGPGAVGARMNEDWESLGDMADRGQPAPTYTPKPITPNQRGKLRGMLKQAGVLDGDKDALMAYAQVDFDKASQWINAMVKAGADGIPWDILANYIALLRNNAGKTNEDIKDFCQSYNVSHISKLDRSGRDALIAWLSVSEDEISHGLFVGDENEYDETTNEKEEWIKGANVSAEMLAKMDDASIAKSISAWKARQDSKNA